MFSLDSLPRPTKTYHYDTYDRISKQHGFDGTGKTVVITGGAAGVGLSFSKAFARSGVSRIAIISRSVNQQIEAKAELNRDFPTVQVLLYQASVTDQTRIHEIFKELGEVDIVVLNAAIAHRRAQATEVTIQETKGAFDVNVTAPFTLSQAFLAGPMPKSGKKTILNVSAAAAQMSNPYRSAYGASKAAGVQIMQSLAAQFPTQDVRIYSFHPGSFYTAGVAANMPKDMVKWEDINLPADFALWLAGSESDFLHGRYLWAHWDVDELIAIKGRIEEDPTFLTIGLVQ